MKITYLYHNGFLIEQDECYILCDYFLDGYALPFDKRKTGGVVRAIGSEACGNLVEQDEVRPMDESMNISYPDTAPGVMAQLMISLDKPLYILSTHFHKDHFLPFILNFFAYAQKRREQDREYPEVKLVFSSDIKKYRRKFVAPYLEHITFLAKGDVYEDETLKITALGSTDVGVSFAIESLSSGKSIYHGGDFNYWHWMCESTDSEIKEAHEFFLKELAFIKERFDSFDIVMIDCDPRMVKDYLAGASELYENVPFSMLIPMHVWEMGHKTEDALRCDALFSKMNLKKGNECDTPQRAITLVSPQSPLSDKHIWLPVYAGDYCYVNA